MIVDSRDGNGDILLMGRENKTKRKTERKKNKTTTTKNTKNDSIEIVLN